MRIRLVIGSLIALVAVAPSRGETPLGSAFTYQGQLKQGGAPFDGTADFEFTLWDDAGSGDPPIGGTQVGGVQAINALPVTAGLFTVALNAGGEFGGDAFNGNARWVQIAVRSPAGSGGSFTTLAPRQPLTAAPHALFALNAASLILPLRASASVPSPDAVLTAINTGTGFGIRGVARAPSGVSVPSPYKAGLSGDTDTGDGVHGTTSGTGGIGVLGYATGDGGAGVSGHYDGGNGQGVVGLASAPAGTTYGGFFRSSSTNGRGVYGLAAAAGGLNYGGWFESNSTDGRGVYGLTTAAAGGFNYGVVGQSAGTNGRGVYGLATAAGGITKGVYGQSESTLGTGVFGLASAASGTTYGVYGQSNSADGRGVFGLATAATGGTYGGRFECASPSGNGVFGWATAASGITYGVRGQSDSSLGRGVFGYAPAGIGVVGQSNSTSGTGVFGLAAAATGPTEGGHFRNASTSGRGVFAIAYATSGTTYGVHGASNSAAGYDFFAAGAGVNYGSPSSIRWKSNIDPIDRPLEKLARLRGVYFDWDAEHGGHHDVGMVAEEVGKVLPEIVNYEENGIDANGMDYSKLTPLLVEAVNELHAKVTEKDTEIAELRARLGKLEALVGELTQHARDMPLEVEMQSPKKGTYQHPEFYGQPPEKGMNYDAERVRPAAATSLDATPQ